MGPAPVEARPGDRPALGDVLHRLTLGLGLNHLERLGVPGAVRRQHARDLGHVPGLLVAAWLVDDVDVVAELFELAPALARPQIVDEGALDFRRVLRPGLGLGECPVRC